MTLPLSLAEAGEIVTRVLAVRGPLTSPALLGVLGAEPALRGLDPHTVLEGVVDAEAMPAVARLPDGRWCHLPALFDGRCVTHRLTQDEARHGFVPVFPDLAVMLCIGDALDVDEGLAVVYPDHDQAELARLGIPAHLVPANGAILLRDGSVPARRLHAGDLICLSFDETGVVIEPARRVVAFPPGAAPALASLVHRHPDGDLEVEDAALALCAAEPELFVGPMPPFSELIAEVGVVQHGALLLPPGTDLRRWQAVRRADWIRRTYGVSVDDAHAVGALAAQYEEFLDVLDAADDLRDSDGPSTVGARAIADGKPGPLAAAGQEGDPDAWAQALRDAARGAVPRLADPGVALALVAETLGTADGWAPVALGVLADSLGEVLAPEPDPDVVAALDWLRGRAYERLGRVEDQQEALDAARSVSPGWPPVLADLAHLASDRGHLGEALDLARAAKFPADDPLMVLLTHLAAVPVRELGRNQPCWCGSGRKYKVCHLGRETLPLEERAIWLYQKAGAYLDRGAWRELLLELATERSIHLPGGLLQGLQDPLVADVALVEGGGLAEFVQVRGSLLPDDERLLAEQWLLAERSVWEVEEVRYARGLRLRDLRSGERVEVRERTASRMLKPGQLLCCQVLPAGETWQLFGGAEPVTLRDRDELLALLDAGSEPVELVTALSRRFAPPVLQNTDGEMMLLCELTARVPDPAQAVEALDARFERDDGPGEEPGTTIWRALVDRPNGRVVHATMRLTGQILVIETNSPQRMSAALDAVAEAVPGIEVVQDRRQRPGEALQTGAGAGHDDGPSLDPEELAAFLGEAVAGWEAAWLDDSIPALKGLTPREAAADPTRREDLVRLLDSFPQDEHPGQMSARRLRAALGLG